MTPFVGAIVFWLLFVIGGTVLWAPPVPGNAAEFLKTLGLSSSIATGLVAPFLAIHMARYQRHVTVELERLRSDYTRDIEVLKSSLSENLEIRKAEIAGQVKAFDAMLSAAHFFYYVLRQQTFDDVSVSKDLMIEADKRAAEASSIVWHLTEEDRSIWYEVYQRSIYLSGMLKASTNDNRTETFNRNATELGAAIHQLEVAGEKVFREAKDLNAATVAPRAGDVAPRSAYLYS